MELKLSGMKSAKVIFTYHVVHIQRTLSNVTTSVYGTTSLRLNNTNALCQTDQISSSQTELFIMPGKTPEKFQAFPFSPKNPDSPSLSPAMPKGSDFANVVERETDPSWRRESSFGKFLPLDLGRGRKEEKGAEGKKCKKRGEIPSLSV